MDDVASAVRAPRPADLSRLEEHQARAETLSERATDFRDSVRSRLGLGEASGGSMSYTHSASSASGMDAALCDAEVCAPGAAAPERSLQTRGFERQPASGGPPGHSRCRTSDTCGARRSPPPQIPGIVLGRQQRLADRFKASLIICVKGVELCGVHIQDRRQLAAGVIHRHDDL